LQTTSVTVSSIEQKPYSIILLLRSSKCENYTGYGVPVRESALKQNAHNYAVTDLPREFILFSRIGQTDSNFHSLHDAGRLDIIHECIVSSLFLSHGLRRDVTFHAILNGPPNPPMHIQINGETLYDVRTDMNTWQVILKKILSGKPHPGITKDKTSFEALLKTKAHSQKIYVLEEDGKDISRVTLGENSLFILGDHVGLPKKAELFAQRFGEKISLGKTPYLAASCITIINYTLDKQAKLGS
jgi:tRNA (pseudouridine54-N1)-methyltransferase